MELERLFEEVLKEASYTQRTFTNADEAYNFAIDMMGERGLITVIYFDGYDIRHIVKKRPGVYCLKGIRGKIEGSFDDDGLKNWFSQIIEDGGKVKIKGNNEKPDWKSWSQYPS